MGPGVGQAAPDFTLPSHLGDRCTLSAYRGVARVVLVFFPFAFTGVCTDELRDLRAHRDRIVRDDTVILTVSCDAVYSLQAFANEVGWVDPMLSDFWPHGVVASSYGVFLEPKGFPTRGTFVIDSEGIVRWSVVNPPGQARSVGQLIEALSGA